MFPINWQIFHKFSPSIDLHWEMLSYVSFSRLYRSPMRELLVIPVHPVRISCSNFVKLEMEVIEASVSCSSSAKYKCFNSFM